jgi:hypothetical protein
MSFGDLNLHGHSNILLKPWCKPEWSQDELNNRSTLLSSTTNQRSYMTLGRLHGPWCKQPLISVAVLCPREQKSSKDIGSACPYDNQVMSSTEWSPAALVQTKLLCMGRDWLLVTDERVEFGK